MTDEQFKSHSFLKISNSPMFDKFLHDYCDEIIDGKPVDVKNYSDDVEWTNEDINKTKLTVNDFFCKSITHGGIAAEAEELVSESALDSLRKCLIARREELEYHLIKVGFLESEHNLVESFDWNLKWVLGTSMMPSAKEPIIDLKLVCVRRSLIKSKHNIDIEMNIVQVEYLINVLEDALKELTMDE